MGRGNKKDTTIAAEEIQVFVKVKKEKQKKPAEEIQAVQRSEGETENKALEASLVDAKLRGDRGNKKDATIVAEERQVFVKVKKKKQKKPAEMRPALTEPVQRSEDGSENEAPEASLADAKLRGDRGNKKDATIAAEEVQVFVKKKKKQKKPVEMRPAARGDRRKGLG